MLKAVLALFLLCAIHVGFGGAPAEAKTFRLGDDKPIIEITIPPDWETASAESGVEATTSNTYLSAEVIDSDDLLEATQSTEQFLAERKIVLDTKSKSQRVAKIAGFQAIENNWNATDADGPTRVRVSVVKLTKDKLLLIFYWRSQAGEKEHGAEVEYVLSSIKPIG